MTIVFNDNTTAERNKDEFVVFVVVVVLEAFSGDQSIQSEHRKRSGGGTARIASVT
jgi:hypothetical protein